MAALVQTISQQSTSVGILKSRHDKFVGTMPSSSQSSATLSYGSSSQRTGSHGSSSTSGPSSYRGTSTPIQPYAFTSTPTAATTSQWQQQQQQYGAYRAPSASSNTPSGGSQPQHTNLPTGASEQPTFAQVAASKAPPERYRRPVARYTDSSPSVLQTNLVQGLPSASTTGNATVVHLYNPRVVADRADANFGQPRPHSAYGSVMPGVSFDDMQLDRQRSDDAQKRFRRRSMHTIDFSGYPSPMTPKQLMQAEEMRRASAAKRLSLSGSGNPENQHKNTSRILAVPAVEKTGTQVRNASAESLVSSRSSNSRPTSSTNKNSNGTAPTMSPASTSSNSSGDSTANHDNTLKLVNVPPRSSSSDVGKRITNPSPLSNPVNMTQDPTASTAGSPAKPPGSSGTASGPSPAAQQLAAINEKGGPSKNKTSRLRRAFSFGSAAELRKATGQDIARGGDNRLAVTGAGKLRQDAVEDDPYEAEQARIAQKQEEGGIGSSIYSGTKLFSNSNDNLSISSTASSASIMLRKMGRGMKKSGRSLKGLFRPKSVVGVPCSDAVVNDASRPAVTMVTVEAERDGPNGLPSSSHSQHGGSSLRPRTDKNMLDVGRPEDRLGSSGTDSSAARKSIVGGERERAEVLATIRKGILKTRSDSPSPSPSTRDTKGPSFNLPTIPHVSDSPNSSAPSTPTEDSHKRAGSIAIGSEDYFVSAMRLRQDTKSAPVTPAGTYTKRNATFSPRIIFYDTFPPGEYDRRGEIATCNRLTPMLAQQIREELNSFKMEMEVHETSKIYTHFF
ncbi:protein BNI4 [Microdochium nivale]|nr:protein BNI4 [Microdochium nivale]